MLTLPDEIRTALQTVRFEDVAALWDIIEARYGAWAGTETGASADI
jgi:hypothetical protein